jgi:cell wall-associated NlpC family hydrolase
MPTDETTTTHNPPTARPRLLSPVDDSPGPAPLTTPPLPGSAVPPPPPADPGTADTPTESKADNPNAAENDDPNTATNPNPDRAGDHDEATTTAAGDPAAAAAPSIPPDALSGLATLGPQLAAPLISAAAGIPTAALAGGGSLIPSLASAVMPQLAALADQLGTGQPPATLASSIEPDDADSLAGPLGDMVGEGDAADQARTKNQTLARQVNALHDVERQLGDTLGLSSARTEGERTKIRGIIDDVETALTSAGVQGDTPEAQAAVLSAMRKALNDAGDVVNTAARDKLTDAGFVRGLIHNYLHAAGAPDTLHAATSSALHGGGTSGARAAQAAHDALGLPYIWGGGGALGPTGGGFDCSGLTQWAIARGSHGRVILPRTTYEQIHAGRAVPIKALAPGDLVFSNFSGPGVPEHVAIYIGHGQIIEAPHRGAPVHISNIPTGAQARRVLG